MSDPTPAKGLSVESKADKPKSDQAPALAPTTGDQPMEDWKPEPRQWTWKDLFTAPMLAFKPKCMLISALTLVAITAWMWLCDTKIIDQSNNPMLTSVLMWVQYTVALVLFSLGGSLVAVFLKADLLDDEFLSFNEALGQYKTRIVPAVMVPLFMMGMLAGIYLVLVYLPVLASSIPYVGPAFYALLYPLVYLFSLFVVLFGIAVWLSVFVFPAIIAIRKHGWFDNVVDTIEAVGTKPHVLFGSLLLSLLMMTIAAYIAMSGMDQLKHQAKYLPDSMRSGFNDTEGRASDFAANDMKYLVNKHLLRHQSVLPELPGENSGIYNSGKISFYQYGTGPVAGVWQALILALILGYIANLFVAGGMLTYLVVREDDYWDDEDLEDLDKLAKELEDEAKRDQGVISVEAAIPAETAKAPEAAKPPEPPTPTDPAKA